MTGPEHYREAEKLVADAGKFDGDDLHDITASHTLAAVAQVHATLALAAAVAASRIGDYAIPRRAPRSRSGAAARLGRGEGGQPAR